MAKSVLIDIPEGLGAETLAATIILAAVSFITVILRLLVRIRKGSMGFDDYLMVIGLGTYMFCCVVIYLACLSGFGAKDDVLFQIDPTGEMRENGLKWMFFFEVGYMACFPFIKTSICVALIRITSDKRYAIPLWLVIIASFVTAAVGLGIVMSQCESISENWKVGPNTCSGLNRLGDVSLAMSAVSIVTDWTCAVIPAFILWNLNMKPRVKASLIFVLALGVLASISTCVRLPLVKMYMHTVSNPGDGLYKGCRISVWSVVECGIGIIAGSLPPLRPLFSRFGLGTNPSIRSPYYRHQSNRSYGPTGSTKKRSSHIPLTAAAAADPIQLGYMRRANRGDSVTTTCRAGPRSHSEWWEANDHIYGNNDSDDCSNRKLVIVKDTRIDVKYDNL
ncbi:hypothetical protein F5Y11DRAFT_343498 [Daldinia sp. FL1419]|nr:hypothetical protein F5Y11DRAFT_343498 [Daldinia sp. FL1419]